MLRTIRLAVLGGAAAGCVLAGASTAVAAQPSGTGAPLHATAMPATSRKVYLGKFFDAGDHDYFPDVRAGSYEVEYRFVLGGAMNTWIDASQPNIVPLPSGRYLGQVGGGAGQSVDTPTFTLTAGTHRITSQSPELYGPVKVYLIRVSG